MEKLEVFVFKKDGALLPQYATDASSGLDLCAFLDEALTMKPLERLLVPTGIFISIPKGFEAEIRPRSGVAYKYGVTVLNTPGTIDADYRGEIKVILVNLGTEPFVIRNGDRIAQMVFKSVRQIEWRLVDALPETERGEGGFGSTGMR
ncbi:MAG: Deoxyuridine 5'-triphosphate nucleotidohydrolase [Syntrophorhabdus sp. PtaU1.Bin058]|nr:MAG: Deoxyuridine 5'-triphosphate nucleotidohydrolase [Syntrophorhabdus sp. PtaU1.Bin058]